MADNSNAARRRAKRSSRPDATTRPADDDAVASAADGAPDDAAAIIPDHAAATAQEGTEAPDVEAAAADDARGDAEADPPADAEPQVDADTEHSGADDATPADSDDAAEAAAQDADGSTPATDPDATTAWPVDGEPAYVASEAMAPSSLWSTPIATVPANPDPSTSLPWLQARAPGATTCPFLRAVGADDILGFPVEAPDAINRCAALREPVPQSLRQQELVCLTSAHVNCPRYLRGATLVSPVATPRVRSKAVLTPAISVSLIILALSFGASVAFGLANGGLVLPSSALAGLATPSATAVAAAPSTGPSTGPSIAVATTPPSVAPSAAPTTQPSTGAIPSGSPGPAPSPKPTAKPSATPKLPSPRAAQLKRCPNKPNCWIYTIHSGDNLFSIAKYFGVPLRKVKALNAWTRTESLRAGRKLILPNPTR